MNRTPIFALFAFGALVSAARSTKKDQLSAHSMELLKALPEATRQRFYSKVVGIADRLGLDPDWLVVLMYFESRLNPSARNASGSATGLIQFTAAAAQDLGTTTAALAKMDHIRQLDYVEKYFERTIRAAGRPRTLGEAYLIIFYPYALKRPDSYVIGSHVSDAKAREIARVNPVFDLNGDGYITRGEVVRYADSMSLTAG